MSTPKFSIVIPVYNVEKYINKCVDSVINQSYKNIEIILVDDGSTDGCPNICDYYSNTFDNIKTIHKENGGLGFARNSGIEASRGEYVCFFDSDDYVEINTIEVLASYIEKYKADLVIANYYRDRDEHISPVTNFGFSLIEGKNNIENFMLDMIAYPPHIPKERSFGMSACFGCYSLSLIKNNNLRFHSERELISEDLVFNIDFLNKAERLITIPDHLYHYRYNSSSLSQVYNYARFKKNQDLYYYLDNALYESFSQEKYKHRIQRFYLGYLRGDFIRLSLSDEKNKLMIMKEMCEDSLVQTILKDYPFKENYWKQRVFNCCISKKRILIIYFICFVVAKNHLNG